MTTFLKHKADETYSFPRKHDVKLNNETKVLLRNDIYKTACKTRKRGRMFEARLSKNCPKYRFDAASSIIFPVSFPFFSYGNYEVNFDSIFERRSAIREFSGFEVLAVLQTKTKNASDLSWEFYTSVMIKSASVQ